MSVTGARPRAATPVDGSSQTRPPLRPRLLLVSGVVLIAVTLRPATSTVSPVLADVRGDLGMTAATAGLLGTAPTLAFALCGAAAPWLARRIGLERVAVVAMLVTALGQVLRALAPDVPAFLLLSLLALGGMGMGNVVLPPLIKRYFPDRVGAMTSAYMVVLTAGAAVPALVAVPLADAAGWRAAIGSWALFAVVAAVPWVVAARRAATRLADARASGLDQPTARHISFSTLLRSPVAWGLTALMGMTSLNTYAMFAWLPVLLADAGVSPGAAGAMLGLYAALGIPTALLVPWAASRMRNPFPLVLVFLACYAVGYTGLLLWPDVATPVWVVAAGLGPGSFPLALVLVNLRSRTTEGSAALSGFSQGVGYLVAGAGPLVVGLLREVTGGWTVAFAVLAGTLVLQVVGGAVVCRPRMVEDDLARDGGAVRGADSQSGASTLVP